VEKLGHISEAHSNNETNKTKRLTAIVESQIVDPTKNKDVRDLTTVIKEKLKNSLTFDSRDQSNEKNELKNMTQIQLKNANLRQQLAESQSKLDHVEAFLKVIQQGNADSTDRIESQDPSGVDPLELLIKYQETVENAKLEQNDSHIKKHVAKEIDKEILKELPKFKIIESDTKDANKYKFAHVLTNLHTNGINKTSLKGSSFQEADNSPTTFQPEVSFSKEGSDEVHFATQSNTEVKQLIKDKMLKPTPEAEAQAEKRKTIIETKQLEEVKDKKLKEKIEIKQAAREIDIAAITQEDIQDAKSAKKLKEKNKAGLLQILPMLDERNRFFELVFGENAKRMKEQLREDYQTHIEERHKERNNQIKAQLNDRIVISRQPNILNTPLKTNSSLTTKLDDSSQVYNNENKDIQSELKNATPSVDFLAIDFKKQVNETILKINNSLENHISQRTSLVKEPLEVLVIASIDKIKELHEEGKKIMKKSQEIEKKVELNTIQTKNLRPVVDIKEAIKIAENILEPENLHKIDDIQKKMTPRIVSQLLY